MGMFDKQISKMMEDLMKDESLMKMVEEKRSEVHKMMNPPIKLKVINKSNNPLPEYATVGSAGMDVRAYITKENMEKHFKQVIFEDEKTWIILKPGERALISTGLYFELPEGYEMQIRPRSGLAIKNGITLANCVGTLDSDYRNELGIILINHGQEEFTINNGDRIAQIVINKYEKVEFEETSELNDTERKGGFGSTGKE